MKTIGLRTGFLVAISLFTCVLVLNVTGVLAFPSFSQLLGIKKEKEEETEIPKPKTKKSDFLKRDSILGDTTDLHVSTINFSPNGAINLVNDLNIANGTLYISEYYLSAAANFSLEGYGAIGGGSFISPNTGLIIDYDADYTDVGSQLSVLGNVTAAANKNVYGVKIDPEKITIPSGATSSLAATLYIDEPNIFNVNAGVDNAVSLYIANAPTEGSKGNYAFLVDSGDVVFDENLVIGGSKSRTETLSNTGFALGDSDLFVAGLGGFEGNVYTDSSFIAGSTTTYGDNSIVFSSGANISLPSSGLGLNIGSGLLSFDTSNSRVGINTTGPDRRLDILDDSNPQLRLTQSDASKYADFKIDSSGDLIFLASGNNFKIIDDNLWICSGGTFGSHGCSSVTPSGNGGSLIVETEILLDNGFKLAPITSTTTGLYDSNGTAVIVFDEVE